MLLCLNCNQEKNQVMQYIQLIIPGLEKFFISDDELIPTPLNQANNTESNNAKSKRERD